MPPTILTPLALGLAAGLNLYATVACLGLAGRLGWTAPLPPELRGLEHPIVIGVALAFFFIEAVAERIPFIDSIWSAIHALLKPIAAALLTSTLLTASTGARSLLLPATAAFLAFAAHVGRGVVRASVEHGHRPRRELLLHAALSSIAVALAITARNRPRSSLALATLTLLWVLAHGPRSWRMFTLTLRAQIARIRGVFGREGWQDQAALPPDLRALLPSAGDIMAPPHRATRAGLKGIRSVGDYRQGWLVVGEEGPSFLYRSLLGPRVVALPASPAAELVPGPWLDAVELPAQPAGCTVFLLKDGPSPDRALPHLSAPLVDQPTRVS